MAGSIFPKKDAEDRDVSKGKDAIKNKFYLSKDGRTYLIIMWRDQNGTQHKKRFYTTRRRDADNELTAIMDKVNKREFKKIEKVKFKDWANKWLEYRKKDKVRPVKERTIVSYQGHIDKYLVPYFGNYLLENITTEDIENFIADIDTLAGKTLSTKSVNNILNTLHGILKKALVRGKIRSNPFDILEKSINGKKNKGKPPHLTKEEMFSFLAMAKKHHPDYYCLFLAAVETGARRGELLGLTWDDVNWHTKKIRINKQLYRGKLVTLKTNYSVREFVISDTLIETLKIHELEQKMKLAGKKTNKLNLVFTNQDGKPMDPDNMVKRHYLPALREAGIAPIKFHALRHTCASLLLADGVDINTVSAQLGHASPVITLQIYSHFMPHNEGKTAKLFDSVLAEGLDKVTT